MRHIFQRAIISEMFFPCLSSNLWIGRHSHSYPYFIPHYIIYTLLLLAFLIKFAFCSVAWPQRWFILYVDEHLYIKSSARTNIPNKRRNRKEIKNSTATTEDHTHAHKHTLANQPTEKKPTSTTNHLILFTFSCSLCDCIITHLKHWFGFYSWFCAIFPFHIHKIYNLPGQQQGKSPLFLFALTSTECEYTLMCVHIKRGSRNFLRLRVQLLSHAGGVVGFNLFIEDHQWESRWKILIDE